MPQIVYDMNYIRQHVPFEIWEEWLQISTMKRPTPAEVDRAVKTFRDKYGRATLAHIYAARIP